MEPKRNRWYHAFENAEGRVRISPKFFAQPDELCIGSAFVDRRGAIRYCERGTTRDLNAARSEVLRLTAAWWTATLHSGWS